SGLHGSVLAVFPARRPGQDRRAPQPRVGGPAGPAAGVGAHPAGVARIEGAEARGLRRRGRQGGPGRMADDLDRLAGLARGVRAHVLRMVHGARASHVGSCFSMADILAVLYGRVLRVRPDEPAWAERDRLLVSKGHAAAAVYAALAEAGFFPASWLETYCQDGTRLAGHVSHHVPGVEGSSGSLGHGLSLGCGMALGGQVGPAGDPP